MGYNGPQPETPSQPFVEGVKAMTTHKGGRLSDDLAFLTVEETADLLRVHKNTIYRWVREGRLPSTRIGKQWRIPRQALERLLGGGEL